MEAGPSTPSRAGPVCAPSEVRLFGWLTQLGACGQAVMQELSAQGWCHGKRRGHNWARVVLGSLPAPRGRRSMHATTCVLLGSTGKCLVQHSAALGLDQERWFALIARLIASACAMVRAGHH